MPQLSATKPKASGRVYLVGAGPGDPDLITVAGLNALRSAEAVVFDALANPRLLDEVSEAAERFDVGKRAKQHKLTQDETNALLLKLARQGRRVVRLKGGDPYLFGRGAEECAYLAGHGIACEVIPGITSGLAAPATAGIPVTHRKVASSVTLVTGHEDPTKDQTSVDYPGLASLIRRGGTVCFYMGVGRLPVIANALMGEGLQPQTPAAIVQWGTLPHQRSARGTLASLPDEAKRQAISSPAIIVIGDVAAIDEPGLDFFTDRPLFGKTILVTRTRSQASQQSQLFRELGAEVIEAPTIRIEPVADFAEINDAVESLASIDQCLVMSSANGVDALVDTLERIGKDARHLAATRIAVVGEATAKQLWDRLRVRPDLLPDRMDSDGLAQALLGTLPAASSVLLLRGDLSRPSLANALKKAGHAVTDLVAYCNIKPKHLPEAATQALCEGRVDWITFASSSSVRNLVDLLGENASWLQTPNRASIGEQTSATLRSLQLEPTVQAATPTLEALVQAMLDVE
jgi:uroporphyrinogen III methyltransferase/synthase